MRTAYPDRPDDTELMLFLWRWKVSTTATLSTKFYPHLTTSTAYKRLASLEKRGLIRLHHAMPVNARAWTLTKAGFLSIRSEIPILQKEGFASEHPLHDLIVAAAHLGDYLYHCPENVALMSEQELRTFPLSEFPSWVPQTQVHRPDGYWRVPIGNPPAVIALEVELNPKSMDEYDAIVAFYQSASDISRVLWIAKTPQLANRIHKLFSHGSSNDDQIHNIVLYSDFTKGGWQAPIRLGPEQGCMIEQILGKNASKPLETFPVSKLLDVRKTYSNSAASKVFEFHSENK